MKEKLHVRFRIEGLPNDLMEYIYSDIGDAGQLYDDLIRHIYLKLYGLLYFMPTFSLHIYYVENDEVARNDELPSVSISADTLKKMDLVLI